MEPSYSIVVEITNKCPNSCPGCYSDDNSIFMKPQQLKFILNKLPDKKNSVIIFSGGEPAIHPKLKEMCSIAKKITTIRPYIITSGARKIDLEEYKKLISGIIVTLKYPIDYLDNSFKGTKKCHENALNILRQAQKLKLNRQINWVMDNQNKYYYLDTVRLAREFDAELNILKFIKFDENLVIREISLKEFENYSLLARKAGRKLNAIVNVFFPCKWSTGYMCSYGINRLCIKPDGSVTGCIYGTQMHGNLLKQGYSKIFQRMSEYMAQNYVEKGCIVEASLKS
jgi:MoaA/NifB/PqqE/SkfB family radical SAM enzyme